MKRIASLMLAAILAFAFSACNKDAEQFAVATVGGDPTIGRVKIVEYGCTSCHTIPGVHGANGTVGPPLNRFALRSYVAGVVPNNPDNLRSWIQNPRSLNPKTAMPNVGVSNLDAKNITTYLYTLQ